MFYYSYDVLLFDFCYMIYFAREQKEIYLRLFSSNENTIYILNNKNYEILCILILTC